MNGRSSRRLRDDAVAIWNAGVRAVDSRRITREFISCDDEAIRIGDVEWQYQPGARLCVVGAGKAGSGMALGVEDALGDEGGDQFQLFGWVNIPDDCVQETDRIHLHPSRPAGFNFPTDRAADGTNEIIEAVASLGPDDMCLCLISGGGSALLPAPAPGISLQEKQHVTELLSRRGADIRVINVVRTALSRVKGGGLAQNCGAGTLVTLIISDVLGDPVESIASGPTIDACVRPTDALDKLNHFIPESNGIPVSIREFLQSQADRHATDRQVATSIPPRGQPTHRQHFVIGNNALAVDACGVEAESRGYSHAMMCATSPEGDVEVVAAHHAKMIRRMLSEPGPDCLITGGEPTIHLPRDQVQRSGGRNQQLVLEVWRQLLDLPGMPDDWQDRFCFLSGGTDGEDGPTDAAGGVLDSRMTSRAAELHLDFDLFRREFNAYPLLDETDGLIRIGPTHTNVCDVRVIVIDRPA